MAIHLSRLAKYHIADFVNYGKVCRLRGEWNEMYVIFGYDNSERHRKPMPEYVMTKEFDICFRKDASPKAVAYLFTDGPEATFWYMVPTGLLSAIVESFLQRSTSTTLRPVFCVCDESTPGPTLLWQELYVDFFPCGRCQRRQLGEEELPGRDRPYCFQNPANPRQHSFERSVAPLASL
ncbi:hypothetical protein AAVH_25706 [Aphelenchoides avenae]|nr:hypothetical protein AAVH_25706 [Aphelenchus avenae]